MARKPGIITQENTFCFICKRAFKTEDHHCLSGAYRGLADRDGLYIPICAECHTVSNHCVHSSRASELGWKVAAQLAWEKKAMATGKTEEEAREAFLKRYEKSWI